MIVTCTTAAEFIACLDAEQVDSVLQKTVRCSIVRRPALGTAPGKDCVKWEIILQMGAVIDVAGGQYLLEVGVGCGCDYTDNSRDTTGTQVAEQAKAALVDYCTQRGLRVLPGILGI